MTVSKEIPEFFELDIGKSFVEKKDYLNDFPFHISIKLDQEWDTTSYNYDEYYRKVFQCFMWVRFEKFPLNFWTKKTPNKLSLEFNFKFNLN